MNFTNNINDVKLNPLEYCYIAEKLTLPSSTAKVTIPKLMPYTSKKKVSINPNIFINASECAPSVSKEMKTTDYLTVEMMKVDFSNISTKSAGGEYIPKGRKMMICFMENDISSAYLTNFI